MLNYHNIISNWITLAIDKQYITELDSYYVANKVLHLIGEQHYKHSDKPLGYSFEQLTQQLVAVAVENGVIDNSTTEKMQLECALYDVITPLPSVVNDTFYNWHKQSAQKATHYFYQLCCDNGYVRLSDIQKNTQFSLPSHYGDIEVTINLSKPEKDPKEIAKQKEVPLQRYPETLLAMSNEGFYGNAHHPARSQHRLIRMVLDNEAFGFQYSPYGYFDEHSILLSQTIRPMAINRQCFQQLIEAIDLLPHYVVGSNADLAIVGGSILSHHHFQAGKHVFPMQKAREKWAFSLGKEVEACVLHWPLSVIRLKSKNKAQLVNVATYILKQWRVYNDDTIGLLAHTNEAHNTITPISYKCEEVYILDLALRNNRTSEQYPLGIFHPHDDKHHIKKENIGLIEVMGRAILPARLQNEMAKVANFVAQACQLNEVATYHQQWAKDIQPLWDKKEDVLTFVYNQMGQVFVKVLEDCAVFKLDEQGQQAFKQFIQHLEREMANERLS